MMSDKLSWMAVFASLAVLSALGAVFGYAPVEASMGIVQKIFYFHVSSALAAYTGFFLCCGASIYYLLKGDRRADVVARAGAEVGVLFCTFVLISGPLWARKAWGTWWTGEPRLMLTMVAALIFYAYVVVRSIGGRTEITRRICAALAILGVADIPLVHFAVQKWRGNHPRVLRNGGISDEMEVALTVAMLAVFSLFTTLVLLRIRVGMAEEKVERLHRLATARGNDIEDRRRSPLLENP